MNEKRIALGVLVLIAVIGGTFAVTRAFFTDTETSTGSTFTVGTLDLDVGGANGSNVEPFVIENIGDTGDIDGSKVWTVNNTGSLPGRLYFKLDNVLNYENGCNEPEALVDVTCLDPGVGEGDLGGVVTIHAYLDGVEKASSTLASANQAVIGNTWTALPAMTIPANSSVQVMLDWSTGENDYGNEIQSDSITFDVGFDLVQIID
ncbi:M73 family metallopeptidase [Patescibacteria group bacterium]|nr:M73 family metallopeptidase [Patescibacteria group bacterium]MBU1457255.1 M73 family metallopeptidase [Patescibacteria group bacterium]